MKSPDGRWQVAGGRTGELPRAVVCPSVPTMVVSSLPRYAKSSPSICAACGLVLAIRARRSGMSESDVLPGVSATPARATETDATETAVAETEVTNTESQPLASDGVRPLALNPQVKLSTRLPCKVAVRLDHRARAAGLSRLACHAEPVGQGVSHGACRARLIDAAPLVISAADRKAGCAVLSALAADLAWLKRDNYTRWRRGKPVTFTPLGTTATG